MFKRFKSIYLILTIFIFCCVLIFGKQYIDKIVFAEKSADAIAIRVIPNLENYSAIHWYKEQNFKGSPQSIIIDGYSGIRDGRTVYVNVGNISPSNVLYTNIYLISYNQQAERQTIDIFSQILNHWKFNTNVLTIGQCSENNNVNCVLDSDCQNNEYCNSQKAKIIRDVNRMENLVELNKAIEKYKNIHNYYPKLNAGSYLPNKTISVWPSWQKVLAQDLAMKLPDDPINKLGDCGDDRFHSITCWDKDNKEFADSDLIDLDINLPENSKVYVYTTTKSGSSYEICAVMESGYVQGLENGSCAESESYVKFGEIDNHVPEINCGDLSGHPSKKFIGNIRANDIDGDLLVWSIDTSGTNWITADWSDAPILQDMFIDNHKKIYAEKAGDFGVYSIKIKVDDSRGGVIEKECSINITVNSSPTVSVSCNVNTRINKVYDCNGISAIDPDGDNIADYIFEGLPSGLSANGPIISGTPNTDGNYVISVKAIDEYGAESYSKSFTLNVNTYCGDGVLQNLNMEGVNEICEVGGNGTGQNDQWECQNCELSGGWCGDGEIQNDYEECDNNGSNTNIPCLPLYGLDCSYCDINCKSHTIQGDKCGDNIIQAPENCELNILNSYGDGTGENNQYECDNFDCRQSGGWCGDGEIQNAYEECDNQETKVDYENRTGKSLTPTEWQSILMSCMSDCKLGCTTATNIGFGCFIGSACQKGKYVCVDNNVVCYDIFTQIFGYPIYDYCCANMSDELQDGVIHGSTFDIVRAIPSDYEAIGTYVADHSGMSFVAQSYSCDNVCARTAQICIGVGLNNPAISNCVAVKHDNGNDCNNTSNQAANDCRARFGKYSNTDCFDGPDIFQNTFYIGEAACYCWSP